MATVSKPRRRKEAPPRETETSLNLNKQTNQEMVPLNFTVPAEFRKQFKYFALDNDTSMVQLLQDMFSFYQQHKQ